MWIDSDGVFQWRNRSRLTSGPVEWTGDSLDDLLDYEWSHSADGARSSVDVTYTRVGVQRSKRSRIVVWQASGQTMDPGDVMEDFAKEASGEAWINVDASFDLFQAETSKTVFNRGEGSWAGYVGYDANGDENGNGKYVGYTFGVEYVGVNAWKITQAWDGKVGVSDGLCKRGGPVL